VRQVLGDVVELRRGGGEPAGQVGAAGRLDGLHRAAAAGALDDPDDRHAHLLRHPLRVALLLLDGGVGRAAADGEVVAGDDDGAAVDGAAADDAVGGRQADQLAVLVIGGTARDGADLAEAALVDQAVDALAHGEPAAIVLALHL